MASAPSAPAFMLSLLRRRFVSLGDGFAAAHEGRWLVWEPGRWKPAQVDVTHQRSDQPAATTGPVPDSLSFHLKTRVPLKLGRANTCDLLINDATVSREHLRFDPEGEHDWSVTVLSASGSSEIGGVPHKPGAAVPLRSGHLIRVGDVLLSYWDVAGLATRLARPD